LLINNYNSFKDKTLMDFYSFVKDKIFTDLSKFRKGNQLAAYVNIVLIIKMKNIGFIMLQLVELKRNYLFVLII